MRKLLLFILLASSLTGIGQEDPATKRTNSAKPIPTTRFGFKGGYNKSIINGRESDGDKTGYIGFELYGSFFADTKLNEKLNFENELLVSWTDDYHFIEIPLHLKYKFTTKWSAFAGPKLDFIADNDNDSFESDHKFRNFGVSVELGVQYNIIGRLFAETRYSLGLINQVTDLGFDINNGKRNTFRLGAGIRF